MTAAEKVVARAIEDDFPPHEQAAAFALTASLTFAELVMYGTLEKRKDNQYVWTDLRDQKEREKHWINVAAARVQQREDLLKINGVIAEDVIKAECSLGVNINRRIDQI